MLHRAQPAPGPIVRPGRFRRPVRDAFELVQRVADGVARGAPMRARGSRRGLNELGSAAEIQLDLRGLTRTTECLAETTRGAVPAVRVEAGVTFETALDCLATSKRSLPTLIGYEDISVVGAVVTGSHGTSLGQAAVLTEDVLALDVVLLESGVPRLLRVLSPSVLSLDIADGVKSLHDDALFDALRVGAWWLGVVVAVVLRTIPDGYVEESRELISWPELKERWRSLLFGDGGLTGLMVWINVFRFERNGSVALTLYRPAEGPARGTRSFSSRFGGSLALRAMLPALGRFGGPWVPYLLAKVLSHTKMEPAVLPRREAFSFGSPNHLPVFAQELGFSLGDIDDLVPELCSFYRSQRSHGANLTSPLGLRLTGGSSAYLAPQFQRPSCMVEQVTVRGTPRADVLHREFFRLGTHLGGRSHWGQRLPDGAAAAFSKHPGRDLFWVQYQRWNAHRLWGSELDG